MKQEGGSLVTTMEIRKQAQLLVREIAQKPDQELITIDAGSLKGLIGLMRDYAVLTHATNSDAEMTTVVDSLVDYVDINDNSASYRSGTPTYRTTDLARIFGVSVTAINNWIDEGRFIGYERQPRKHARIPHFTPFQHRDGSVEPLGLVMERYMKQEHKSFADADEMAMLLNEIEALQQKYGGKNFSEAFDSERLTSEQESDASRWRFYLARLKELS
ncbi:MAG: hypothetical protein E6Y08_21320 [Paenibacillus sp.]|uniref:hypothetical protein n=1 Tax=Paenibacillus sp. TaxID=58172 RepID=UPI00290F9513|nr:hypothetical protein [Paenibacillus sp.]MDU4698359.1 hypothetical protein [Paenibacillus sp.]